MRRWTWVFLVLALGGLGAGALAVRAGLGPGGAPPSASAPAAVAPDRPAPTDTPEGEAPRPDAVPGTSLPGTAAPAIARARAVLRVIDERGGEPLPGYVGGRRFENRERRLPPGRYREYDVHPQRPGRDRGPERLVVEQTTGKAYFTGDHYRTFVPLR